MSLNYFRGIWFIKNYFVKYLNYIFRAEEKDQLYFFDGAVKYEFSSIPYIIKKDSWDYRQLPCILVGPVNGSYNMVDIRDFIGEQLDEDASSQWTQNGGDINLTMSMSIYATTGEEREKITDIISIYLCHPIAKAYFGRHDITVGNQVGITEGSPINIPNIDRPIYNTNLTMNILGVWRDTTDLPDRLNEIIATIDAYTEL